MKNVKLLEKLVILVTRTNALVNEQLKKLIILVNETNTLVNGLLEKPFNVWARDDIGMYLNCANCIDL